MADIEINQRKLAEWIGRTPRQIHNLVELGLPSRVEKGKRVYLWPAALHWYIEYRIDVDRKTRAGGDGDSAAELRRRQAAATADKAETDAELARLDLAKERGLTMTVDDAARQLEHILGGLNSALGNFAGRWAPELVQLPDTRSVRAKLEKAIDELRTLMTAAGDTDAPEPDPENEGGEEPREDDRAAA